MEYSHFSFELFRNEKISQNTVSNMIDVLNCILNEKEQEILQCNIIITKIKTNALNSVIR
jgi:hypothetical protein